MQFTKKSGIVGAPAAWNAPVVGRKQDTSIMNQAFTDYFKCPDSFANFTLAGHLSIDSGYFRLGPGTTCYGQTSSGFRAEQPTASMYDVLQDVRIENSTALLPFDPTQVIDNLRRERYLDNSQIGETTFSPKRLLRDGYYLLRPFMSLGLRRHLQRLYFRGWDKIAFPSWPVDQTVERILEKLLIILLKAHAVEKIPFIWFWPHGSPSCAIITHDIETQAGRDFCWYLINLEDSFGIKSSFQVVPERRYSVSQEFLKGIRAKGFEINIHDLNHDGHLFDDREEFTRRADRINRHAREYAARGFRSGGLYRHVDWYGALEFSYDMSIPNVGHLDPQKGGCCTIMPFFIGRMLEIPLTTTQDYSLFHILGEYSIDLWRAQVDLIMEKHGLASFNIHPDYIRGERALRTYRELLNVLSWLRSERQMWVSVPKDVDTWWRERDQMKLVHESGRWLIEGAGKERARVAYARLVGDRVAYEIEQTS